MSNLKDKSDFNVISADLLMKAGYHASSIHCSYYALFQQMKYTMKNYLNISYEQYYINCQSSSLSSHAYLISLVHDNFIVKGYSPIDAHKVKRRILDLKEQREKADYDNVIITSDESDAAYSSSDKLIKEIKNTFKI